MWYRWVDGGRLMELEKRVAKVEARMAEEDALDRRGEKGPKNL